MVVQMAVHIVKTRLGSHYWLIKLSIQNAPFNTSDADSHGSPIPYLAARYPSAIHSAQYSK